MKSLIPFTRLGAWLRRAPTLCLYQASRDGPHFPWVGSKSISYVTSFTRGFHKTSRVNDSYRKCGDEPLAIVPHGLCGVACTVDGSAVSMTRSGTEILAKVLKPLTPCLSPVGHARASIGALSTRRNCRDWGSSPFAQSYPPVHPSRGPRAWGSYPSPALVST